MKEKVLILSPHVDDGELGCGGTMARLLREGHDVYYALFSDHDGASPENCLIDDCKSSLAVLGLTKGQFINMADYKVRYFFEARQEILDDMINLGKEITPTLVILPSSNDTHQDHRVIYEEGLRAFKQTNLIGYEFLWNNFRFNTRYYMRLKRGDIEQKLTALGKYSTQWHRYYMKSESIEGMAMMRGTQISERYAEAFEVLRIIR